MTAATENSAAMPPTAHVTPATLAKASLGALVVAAIVTILFVIPAETGDDPTGVGKALGITGMSAEGNGEQKAGDTDTNAAKPAAKSSDASPSKSAWHEEVRRVELAPFRGTELKARMKAGDGYAFRWTVNDGKVMVDMHGDPPNAGPDDFTSYWEQAESTGQNGTFVAPFDGIHGWYWRNLTDKPVTVELTIAGHYEELIRP